MENKLINIANLSPEFPIFVSEQEYNQLNKRVEQGWSNCKTQTEWMVKLHYLRQGYKDGIIEKSYFFQRERELVMNWWRKWT